MIKMYKFRTTTYVKLLAYFMCLGQNGLHFLQDAGKPSF